MMELLCLISNEKEDKIIKPLYDKYTMAFNLTAYGKGTASSSLLEYFGLEEIRKYIYFSLISSCEKKSIFEDIKNNLELEKHGNGICFCLPVASSTKYVMKKINSKEIVMKEKENFSKNVYHLIVTIVTEGFSEQVMNAAKKVGASGGTLIEGRSIYQTNSKRQFLGFSIEPEKDVILIVADEKKKTNIMNEIVKATGLKTEGGGIVFSLPISDVIGLYEENA